MFLNAIWRGILILLMIATVIIGVVCIFGMFPITLICIPVFILLRKCFVKAEEKHLIMQQQMSQYWAEEATKPTITGALIRKSIREEEASEIRRQQQLAQDISDINRKLNW